jgi:hypothetical protein
VWRLSLIDVTRAHVQLTGLYWYLAPSQCCLYIGSMCMLPMWKYRFGNSQITFPHRSEMTQATPAWWSVTTPTAMSSGTDVCRGLRPMQSGPDQYWRGGKVLAELPAELNIFLRICTHTQTITISSDLCPPIAWHVPTHAHPFYSNCARVFKNCVMCITRLHQVLVGSDK